MAGELLDFLCEEAGQKAEQGVVLVASKRARAYLRDIVRVRYPHIRVIAHEEVAPRYSLEIAGKIEISDGSKRQELLNVTLLQEMA